MDLVTTPSHSNRAAEATALSLVANELERVERRILELCGSQESQLTEIANELIGSGGKRIRPALALLVFRAAGGADPTDVIDIGAALELIHSATLLHDDILDSGQTRRGRASPLARHGIALTLVTGDFLFSKAFGVAGRFDAMIVTWAMEACTQLCEGEILQQRFRRNPEVCLDDYLAIAAAKTASLFSQASRIGAHLAGGSTQVTDAMRSLGHGIGIGFQMVDDLLDVVGPAELIGKPVGTDLREGSPSLPIVLGLERLPEVRSVFLHPSPDPAMVESALTAFRRSEILDEVRSLAATRIGLARERLEVLEPSVFRDALDDLARELLSRTT